MYQRQQGNQPPFSASNPNGFGELTAPHASRAAPPVDERMTVELSRPIVTHKGDVRVLQIREPKFEDWINCGPVNRRIVLDPRENGGRTGVEIVEDATALLKWMMALTGLGRIVLETMPLADSRKLAAKVMALIEDIERGNSSSEPMT